MSKARDLADGTFDTDTLVVDAANNSVGIGTSSPLAALHVSTSTTDYIGDVVISGTRPYLVFDDTTSGENGFSIGVDGGSVTFGQGDFSTNTNVYGTERMRIDSSGNVLVGKTSTAIGTTGISFSPNGLSTFSRTAGNPSLGLSSVGAGGKVASFYLTSSEKGYIEVTSSATNYVTSSDYRLKENVVDLTGASDRINQIPVHRFNFITDPDTTVDGFLAHEVQDIVPEAITGTHNEVDEDGNPVYQGIDQSKLVPLLTAALQEALSEIADLKTRVAALETP